MNRKAKELQARTHAFLVKVVEFCRTLSVSIEGRSFSTQLIDAAGSVDSNYGAACKARSRKEFIAKVAIAGEEADESKRWLEALRDTGHGDRNTVATLIQEAHELAAILTASAKTAQRRLTESERQHKAEAALPRRAR